MLSRVKYWDYSREAEIDGVQAEQYLYVEMLLANGYITIWQGQEVDPQCVEVFATGGDAKKIGFIQPIGRHKKCGRLLCARHCDRCPGGCRA